MFDRNLMKLEGMKGVLGALVILALVQAASTIAQVVMIACAVSGLWEGSAPEAQAPLIAAFLACFACTRLAVFAQEALLERFSLNQAENLRSELVAKIFDPKAMLASRVGTGRAATAAGDGIDEIQTYIRIIPPKMIGMLAISIPILVFAFTLDWVSGIILAVMFPVIIFFMILLGKQSAARAERQYAAYTRLSNRFMDTLRGLPVLKAFGADAHEGDSVLEHSERLRRATVRTLSTATLSSAVLDLCATFGVAAVAMMLAFRLMDGSMTLFTALAALMLAPEYFAPIRAFAGDFHASLDGKNALADVLDLVGDAARGQGQSHPASEACISWNSESSLVLKGVSYQYGDGGSGLDGIDLTLRAGQRVGIVGRSGSGKTTLANVVSGLVAPASGETLVDGMRVDLTGPAWKRHVRYIPQSPYIFRATLRDNVRFYAPDASEESVLEAARSVGLGPLVDELPDGLDTFVGDGGRGLSGGQAHRVALARILLDREARILVFDEPTAHLDIETELELKPAMLAAMRGKLVVFATHRQHWARDMDRLFVMEGGRAREIEPGRDAAENGLANAAESSHAEIPEEAQERPTAGTATPSLSKWLIAYVKRYKRSVAVALLLGLAASVCTALLMFTSGYLISATANPGITLFAVMVPIALVQIFGLGRPIARYLERLVSHDWVLKVTSDLRLALYKGIDERIDDPARAQAAGDYLGALSDDVAHLQNLYLRVAFPIAIAALLALGATCLFAFFDPLFGCAMLVLFAAVALLLPVLTLRLTKRKSVAAKQKRTEEYARLSDDILGATDWILARRTSTALETHAAADSRYRALEASARRIERTSSLISALILGIGACIVVVWAAGRFGGGLPNANWIAAFTLGFFPLVESLASLPGAFAQITVHEEAVRRLDGYVGANQADRAAGVNESDAAAPSDAALVFSSVAYSYPGSSRKALDNVTLAIEPGQSVAILGRSGSGKTTLARLAQGVLLPSAGSVKACGRKADAQGPSRMVGYIGHAPYLFNRTLRENLTLGVSTLGDEHLVDILRSVGLGQKYDSLEHGLDTVVGETGTGFSGGEAHRIALARVLVADTPIVLVDEPFASLDPETEHDLLSTLLAACEGRTLIAVTHHLAEIERFDRVVFLEDGQVKLDGSPTKLADANAYFAALLAFDRS